MVERRKRSSVTEGVIVRADGTRENLGILSTEERPFPEEFLTTRQTREYQQTTDDEVAEVQEERSR